VPVDVTEACVLPVTAVLLLLCEFSCSLAQLNLRGNRTENSQSPIH